MPDQGQVPTLSTTATLLWGLLGGFIGAVVVFALPELRRLFDPSEEVHKRRIFITLIMIPIYTLIGGVIAVMLGDATVPKHAFFYGVGAEGAVLKGGVEVVGIAGRVIQPRGRGRVPRPKP